MAPKPAGDIPLKAIVFADRCDGRAARFGVLNRLHNAQVLSWQLAALARSGVKEVVVLSAQPVEVEYRDPLQRIEVATLCQPSWQCEGDALREVETRSDLRPQDDFIMVRAGALFNVSASGIVAEHKARRAKDRNWLLSSAMRRGAGDVLVVVTAKGEIRKYVERGALRLDARAGSVDIVSHVADCGIDVCAPEVLLEFKENFDYDTVRSLTIEKLESGDAETMGNRMFARFIDEDAGEYAMRVNTLHDYARVSREMLFGWIAPLSIHDVQDACHLLPHDVCIAEDGAIVNTLRKGGWTSQNTVVGTDVSIGAKSTIVNSAIGNRVTIGDDVRITNCILDGGVVVESGVVLQDCIVSEKCVVKKNSKCLRRCVLDSGVVIGENVELVPGSLVSTRLDSELDVAGFDEEDVDDLDGLTCGVKGVNVDNDEREALVWSVKEVGEGGVGRIVPDALKNDPLFDAGEDGLEEEDDDDEDELEELDEMADVGDTEMNGATDMGEFQRELYELLEKDRLEGVALDNTLLEANSLRMSYDVTFPEMLAGCCVALARNAMAACAARGDENVFAEFKRAFERYAPLTERYAEEEGAVDAIGRIARAFAAEGKMLSQLLWVLYDKDVVEEDAILRWAAVEDICKRSDEPYVHVKQFIEWLEEDDEEVDGS